MFGQIGADGVWLPITNVVTVHAGEDLAFVMDAAVICNGETAGEIRLDCMDDNSDEIVKATGEVKADDFIGAAVMSFMNAPVGKKWRLDDQWLPLKDESDKNSGSVRVNADWMPPEVYHVYKEICAIYVANGKQEKVATVDVSTPAISTTT